MNSDDVQRLNEAKILDRASLLSMQERAAMEALYHGPVQSMGDEPLGGYYDEDGGYVRYFIAGDLAGENPVKP